MSIFGTATSRRRWGDNDKHFGPFTFSYSKTYRPIAVVLASAEEDYPGCSIRFSAFGLTFISVIPAVIKPHRQWVDTSKYEWAQKSGAGGYWDEHQREYGFSLSDGFLNISLGRQTNDSSTEQRKGYFLPWTQWRFIRTSWYGLAGEHLRTDWETDNREVRRAQWDSQHDFKASAPSASFEFFDFDGELISVRTLIEEREWKLGTGLFKWLSFFRKARIRRSLDLDFSKETGRRKGSWKGGTTGHSIDMLPNELHEAAFRRYCAAHEMTFGATTNLSTGEAR